MIADTLTVMWKEWRELLFTRGSLRGGLLGMAMVLAAFGVFLPLNTGRAWLDSPAALVYWLWVPLLLVTGVVADSFAGERERHTLETLLASRLADASILWGKVGTAVSYAWGLSMASVLLGAVTVSVSSGRPAFYPLATFALTVVVTLVASFLAAAAGVLISLRAQSVRQAQQTLSIAIMALLFIPILASSALPAGTRASLGRLLTDGNVLGAVLVAATVLLLLAVVLMAIARARFRRSRLILD